MATNDENDAVNILRTQYVFFVDDFEMLKEKCGGDQVLQRQLQGDYLTALNNYLEGQDKIFEANNAAVVAIIAAAGSAKSGIDASLEGENKIAATLHMITSWVKTGASLIALAK